jgi:N-acetyl sugar amidotransferase
MDTSAININFDESGVCNYCKEFISRSGETLSLSSTAQKIKLDALVSQIKSKGKGRRYDCIVGVSGGVDSSWVLIQAVKLGLRPLAVHMDNGWNSELAQSNIESLVRALGVDLYTHVINWNEYRKLMQAFFDADVIDVELLYDNAMFGVNYKQAKKYSIAYILGGMNQATEGMGIPKNWNWFKFDRKNIKSIGSKFGSIKLKTFPAIGTLDYIYYEFVKKIKWTSILDYMQYNKQQSIDIMVKEYGYKPYPYKHYESVFTRFYQGYILPKKFGVDKRRLHLSTLVMSGQMRRDEALKDLEAIPYPSVSEMEFDKQYFLKKMNWTEEQLEEYLVRPECSHLNFPSERPLWDLLARLYGALPWLKSFKK